MVDVPAGANEPIPVKAHRRPNADMMSALMTSAAKVYSNWENGCLDGEWVGGISMLDQPLIEACFELVDQTKSILSAVGIDGITLVDITYAKKKHQASYTQKDGE